MFVLGVKQMIKAQVVELKPNKTMQQELDKLCDYRRYCWNQALATWQDMYEARTLDKDNNPSPNERRIRDELVDNKADWQFALSRSEEHTSELQSRFDLVCRLLLGES